jgi:MFS family permease
MVGFGETYLPAFALAVGLGQVTAGLTASLPLIAGGLLQLAAPRCVKFFGSYRRWVVTCASIQALSYVPLVVAAVRGEIGMWALYLVAAIYWGFGMAAGPVWNCWIDGVVPRPALAGFLAVRSRLTQIAAWLAFLVGGLVLYVFDKSEQVLLAFAALFALAGVARLVSAGFLRAMDDASDMSAVETHTPVSQVAKRFLSPTASRFLLFMLVQQVSVHIAAPYFSPYMLAHLSLDYMQYVALVSASYLAKIAFYPLIAKIVRKVGAYRAMWVAAIGVSPMPIFWFWTPDLWSLVLSQVFAGFAWGTFELSSALLVFDRIDQKERLRILTFYNLLNAVAVVGGSLIGGAMLKYWEIGEAYRYVFIASATARLLSIAALARVGPMTVKFRTIAMRTIGMRPGRGAMDQPILTRDD